MRTHLSTHAFPLVLASLLLHAPVAFAGALVLSPRHEPGDRYALVIETASETEAVTKRAGVEPFRERVEQVYRAQVEVLEVDAEGRAIRERHERVRLTGARGGETGNLIVKLPGTAGRTREPRRMLMAHMDTVPLCVGCKPEKLGNRVVPASSETALGADDRAGCATVLTAIETILKHDLPHPPLTLLWTVQEEIGLHGARNVARSKLGGPAMAFNFDGGEPYKLVTGATGAYRMKIHVTGIAAHAGVHPERGVSAAVFGSFGTRAVADGFAALAGGGSGRTKAGANTRRFGTFLAGLAAAAGFCADGSFGAVRTGGG